MRRFKTSSTCAICVTIAFTLGGFSTQPLNAQDVTTDPSRTEVRRAGKLIGTDVLNRANEKIARIADVVMTTDGEPLYVVLSYGGLAGVGAKYTAAPWNAVEIRHVNGKWAANLDMTSGTIEKAPTFQQENYKDLMDQQWVTGARSYFAAKSDQAKTDQIVEPLKLVIRASKILDADLKNDRGEKLGDVEELLLDTNNRVEFAVIGRGGVLDIGENHIPMPWRKLGLAYNKEDTSITATTEATKEQLEKAPVVKADNYSTMLAPGFKDQVNRHFGLDSTKTDASQPKDD